MRLNHALTSRKTLWAVMENVRTAKEGLPANTTFPYLNDDELNMMEQVKRSLLD